MRKRYSYVIEQLRCIDGYVIAESEDEAREEVRVGDREDLSREIMTERIVELYEEEVLGD